MIFNFANLIILLLNFEGCKTQDMGNSPCENINCVGSKKAGMVVNTYEMDFKSPLVNDINFFQSYLKQPLLSSTTDSNPTNDLVRYYPQCKDSDTFEYDCYHPSETDDGYMQCQNGEVCLNKYESQADSTFPDSGFSTNFVREYRFYFYATQTGNYKFQYAECSAYCGMWTGSYWSFECNKINGTPQTDYYMYVFDESDLENYLSYNYVAGKFYPMRLLFAISEGDAHMKLSITAPDGTSVKFDDTAVLFDEIGTCPSSSSAIISSSSTISSSSSSSFTVLVSSSSTTSESILTSSNTVKSSSSIDTLITFESESINSISNLPESINTFPSSSYKFTNNTISHKPTESGMTSKYSTSLSPSIEGKTNINWGVNTKWNTATKLHTGTATISKCSLGICISEEKDSSIKTKESSITTKPTLLITKTVDNNAPVVFEKNTITKMEENSLTVSLSRTADQVTPKGVFTKFTPSIEQGNDALRYISNFGVMVLGLMGLLL